MKEQYIKQVKKELHLSAKAKKEVLRDLNEIFASAMEHGETEQQVIERLGSPKEFADNTAEQFGVHNAASRKQKRIISIAAALLVVIISFVTYVIAKSGSAPEGAIGQADAMTNIQVEAEFGIDLLPIFLAVGILAALFAAVQTIHAICKSRRQA